MMQELKIHKSFDEEWIQIQFNSSDTEGQLIKYIKLKYPKITIDKKDYGSLRIIIRKRENDKYAELIFNSPFDSGKHYNGVPFINTTEDITGYFKYILFYLLHKEYR